MAASSISVPDASACFEHVGEGLADHEVRRALDVLGEPLPAQGLRGADDDGHRESAGAGLDRRDQAVVAEHRRVDAVRQLPQLGEQLPHVRLHLGQERGRRLVPLHLVARQAELGDERDHLLLGAVVEIALDAAAFGVLRAEDPVPRPGQLAEALGQLRGEADVRDRRGRLPAERGEQLPVLGGVAAVLGAALDAADQLLPAAQVLGQRDGTVRRARRLLVLRRPRRALPGQRDADPPGAEALAHGAGQPGHQLGEADAALERRAQAPQDLVVVDPTAEHPPVGPRLQPTAHRLEGDRDADGQEHRQLHRDLAAEGEPGGGRDGHVHRADAQPEDGVDGGAAEDDVDVEQPVPQHPDDDADGQHQHRRDGDDGEQRVPGPDRGDAHGAAELSHSEQGHRREQRVEQPAHQHSLVAVGVPVAPEQQLPGRRTRLPRTRRRRR